VVFAMSRVFLGVCTGVYSVGSVLSKKEFLNFKKLNILRCLLNSFFGFKILKFVVQASV